MNLIPRNLLFKKYITILARVSNFESHENIKKLENAKKKLSVKNKT